MHAFPRREGRLRDLRTLGGTSSGAYAVNAASQVAGWSTRRDGRRRAVLWDDSGICDLGTPGGSWSQALGLDDRGQVVGWSLPGASAEPHAFYRPTAPCTTSALSAALPAAPTP